MALVELSVVEQRYQAVLAVLAGDRVTEVAARSGVSRQSVHSWVARYAEEGLVGLEDRSRRPDSCPHQAVPEVEAAVCELRRGHPRWGARRIVFELGRFGCPGRVPSRMSVYRILVRHGLIEPVKRRRGRRRDYARWQRAAPMELWQMDIVRRGTGHLRRLPTSRHAVASARSAVVLMPRTRLRWLRHTARDGAALLRRVLGLPSASAMEDAIRCPRCREWVKPRRFDLLHMACRSCLATLARPLSALSECSRLGSDSLT